MKYGAGAFLTFLLVSQTAHAGDISEIVSGMTTAAKRYNYEGTFVLRKPDSMITMHVVHGVDDRGVWESMESLNGEARKIVRFNNEVMSIYPGRKLVTISQMGDKPGLHPILPENLDKLENYYTIVPLGDDRIAGRQTSVLNLQPRDEYRYGYRYWLDDDTGVLLKCDLLDENDDIVEQMMYTSFQDRADVPRSAFKVPKLEGYTRKELKKDKGKPTNIGWQVSNLPNGFMLTQSTSRDTGAKQSYHLMYSDGLASVSVFIEPGDYSPHYLEGASTMGALNAYGKRVDSVQVTVMGEVPEATVARIANSIERMQ